jgi:hypothetical protein
MMAMFLMQILSGLFDDLWKFDTHRVTLVVSRFAII